MYQQPLHVSNILLTCSISKVLDLKC